MKDYEHDTITDWANKIADKALLVGEEKRTDPANNPDNRINNTDENTVNDTGLYELYKNVVEVFVDRMIKQAEKYAGTGEGTAPTQDWISGTGNGRTELGGRIDHGPGMSYSYGGKQDISAFNTEVAGCQPADTGSIAGLEPPDTASMAGEDGDEVDNNEYRGNIDDSGDNCTIAAGNKKWPGLIDTEYNLWYNSNSRNGPLCFAPAYWAGIDCSGLVQRSLDIGSIDGVNMTIPLQPEDQNVEMLFTENADDKLFWFEEDLDELEYIKKGDLARYGIWHVSMIYSDGSITDTRYEIIHAYGGDDEGHYTFPDIPEAGDDRGQEIFGRRVMTTFENTATPNGFGRIRLWD